MGLLSHLFYPWGLVLQGLAIIHFIRRRPDTYWLYIILFLGPVGALIYLFVEVTSRRRSRRPVLQRLLAPKANQPA